MGHFSVEFYAPPGSTLSANQHSGRFSNPRTTAEGEGAAFALAVNISKARAKGARINLASVSLIWGSRDDFFYQAARLASKLRWPVQITLPRLGTERCKMATHTINLHR